MMMKALIRVYYNLGLQQRDSLTRRLRRVSSLHLKRKDDGDGDGDNHEINLTWKVLEWTTLEQAATMRLCFSRRRNG